MTQIGLCAPLRDNDLTVPHVERIGSKPAPIMKRYLVGLIILTIIMMVFAFAVKWMGMPLFAPVPIWMLPATVLYFAVVYGVQYWMTVKSVNKRTKDFIQFFLATTIGVLFLHLVVLVGGMLMSPHSGKRFAIGFLILYVVYTVHMVFSFVRAVRKVGGFEE